MATFTVKSGDSSIFNLNAAFATSHDAASGTVRGGTEHQISCRFSGGNYVNDRGFLVFDTSAIGAGSTITAVTLTLKTATTRDDTSANRTYNVYSSTSADPPVGGDYSGGGTTAWATAISGTSWGAANGGNNLFTFNSTGIAGVSKTGLTKMSVRDVGFDVSNIAPGVSTDTVSFYTSTGTTPAVLTVTFTAGGVSKRLLFMGIGS